MCMDMCIIHYIPATTYKLPSCTSSNPGHPDFDKKYESNILIMLGCVPESKLRITNIWIQVSKD